MSKFNRPGAIAAPSFPAGPIVTTGSTLTHEGGAGFTRDSRGDLFMLAIANMVGEDTFYESAGDRDNRFRTLVQKVAVADLGWMERFLPFLRSQMFLRSASVVAAAETVRAVLEAGGTKAVGAPEGTLRRLVASVLLRADEPAELLAYWTGRYGKKVPQPIKRGIADYLTGERFGEYAAMKYDGTGKAWRLGDVVEMTHPKGSPARSALFAYLLDRRHHSTSLRAPLDLLPMVAARRVLEGIPVEERRAFLVAATSDEPSRCIEWRAAGITWEWVSGWLPGGMDAQAWEAVIPKMGYMALLRNLRNFDDAGVSDEVAEQVAARLASPEQVAKGMQFPYRYWSAHQAAGASLRWSGALDKALRLSCGNIPELPGRTLILIDTSASMTGNQGKSKITPVDNAILFGAAVARRNLGRVDVVGWADQSFEFPINARSSLLTDVVRMRGLVGSVGHGTYLQAGMRHLNGHDRVFIFTDMQVHDGLVRHSTAPRGRRVYGWNLGGYASSAIDTREPGNYELGGLSDATFRMIPLLEAGENVGWPF